ncbi:MAG: PepSY-associated TM helix domain-containing protein [Alphaproteobacteria bacterium]
MIKKTLFQLHWFVGITAGIVLAIVGVTGALLSFEHEILRLINPGVLRVEALPAGQLSPAELMTRLQAANPGRNILSLSVSADPTDSARVSLSLPSGNQGDAPAGGPPGRMRAENRYVDPYTAELLGQPRGQQTFRLIMQWHRWLAAGDIGKQIVGASTVLLIGLSLTGLYLRWPRRPLDWRAWFKLDFKKKGRGFLWDLHAVIGAWVLIPYVVMSLSGLFWSYDWYRSALYVVTGTPRPTPPGAAPAQPQRSAQQAHPDSGAPRALLGTADVWTIFLRESGGYSSATLRPAANPNQPYTISYQVPNPPHERANNTLTLDPVSGDVRNHRRYAELPFGQKIMASIFTLHSGSFFGMPGLIIFMIASLAMPLFAVTGWMLYLGRRKIKRARRAALAASHSPAE